MAKDFRLLFPRGKNKSDTILRAVMTIVVVGLFLLVEVLLYRSLYNRIKNVYGAPRSFTTLFLFILSCLSMLFGLRNAEKLFFDAKDETLLATLPLTEGQRVFSKSVLLFLSQSFEEFIMTYPVFVSYGILAHRQAFFFFATLFYSILMFFFEYGIILVLVIPYHLLDVYLQKHRLIELLLVLGISIGLSYLYGKILNAFVEIISNSGGSEILNTNSIENLGSVTRYFVTASYLVNLFMLEDGLSFAFYLIFTIGSLGIGLTLFLLLYPHFRSFRYERHSKAFRMKRLSSPTFALIRKEIILLFRDEDRITDFSLFLLLEPYLLLIFFTASRTLFNSGVLAYYRLLLPNLNRMFNLFLCLLYSVAVISGASGILKDEGYSLLVIKTMPVKAGKQMGIKFLIPYLSFVLMTLVSVLVLGGTGFLDWVYVPYLFVMMGLSGFTLLALLFVEEMKATARNGLSRVFSSLYADVFPALISLAGIGLIYLKLPLAYVTVILFGLSFALALLAGLDFFLPVKQRFLKMEVVAE